MDSLLSGFLDTSYFEWLLSFVSLVPAGLVLSVLVYLVGWLVGWFIRLLKQA